MARNTLNMQKVKATENANYEGIYNLVTGILIEDRTQRYVRGEKIYSAHEEGFQVADKYNLLYFQNYDDEELTEND
jgi:hypothetical protein